MIVAALTRPLYIVEYTGLDAAPARLLTGTTIARFVTALVILPALLLLGSALVHPQTITVFAAAGLKNSVDDVARDYRAKTGVKVAGASATRFDLLRNRLALVAPAGSKAALRIEPGFDLASALGTDRLAMADPTSVPAGKHGKAALEALGVWKAVAGKVASAGDVRGALLLVARGEAPYGIVYSTDAAVEPKVRVVDLFPESTHPPSSIPRR